MGREPFTLCRRGHLLHVDNLRIKHRSDGRTQRVCIQCENLLKRKRRAAAVACKHRQAINRVEYMVDLAFRRFHPYDAN